MFDECGIFSSLSENSNDSFFPFSLNSLRCLLSDCFGMPFILDTFFRCLMIRSRPPQFECRKNNMQHEKADRPLCVSGGLTSHVFTTEWRLPLPQRQCLGVFCWLSDAPEGAAWLLSFGGSRLWSQNQGQTSVLIFLSSLWDSRPQLPAGPQNPPVYSLQRLKPPPAKVRRTVVQPHGTSSHLCFSYLLLPFPRIFSFCFSSFLKIEI